MTPLQMHGSLLVVDCDGEAVRELRRMAGFPGVVPSHASSWVEACEELSRHHYDAVFLDFSVLEESAEDCFHKIESAAAGVPVVLMEKKTSPDFETVDGDHVFGFLIKPLKASAVRSLIRQVFRLRSMGEEIRGLENWISGHALKDPLTGLYNGRYLEERIRSEFKRSVRYGVPLSAVGIAFQNFQTAAEAAAKEGRNLQREAASYILKFARACDVITDAGVCQFVIVLPDTPKKGALVFAHRLLESLQRDFLPDGENSLVYASLGVASYPQDGVKGEQNLLDLMRRAVLRARKHERSMVYSFPGLDIAGVTKRKP